MANDTIAAGLADALDDVVSAVGENLVVQPWYVPLPAAPTIDIYPGDPFTEDLGFGLDATLFWTVRARIHTVDHQGAQGVLLALMEPWGDTSVREALLSDQTLNGVVQTLDLEGPSGYVEFVDVSSSTRHLGVTWRVRTIALGPT